MDPADVIRIHSELARGKKPHFPSWRIPDPTIINQSINKVYHHQRVITIQSLTQIANSLRLQAPRYETFRPFQVIYPAASAPRYTVTLGWLEATKNRFFVMLPQVSSKDPPLTVQTPLYRTPSSRDGTRPSQWCRRREGFCCGMYSGTSLLKDTRLPSRRRFFLAGSEQKRSSDAQRLGPLAELWHTIARAPSSVKAQFRQDPRCAYADQVRQFCQI